MEQPQIPVSLLDYGCTTGEDDYEYDHEELFAMEEYEAPDYEYDGEDTAEPWEPDDFYWYDDWTDETAHYEHDDTAPDDDYEEVYATYLDARRRFADLRAARGFWPVMAVPPSSSGTSSAPPTTYAPSKGKPTKGKGKVEKEKEKGKEDSDLSYKKGQHSRELHQRQQCAFDVARLVTIAMLAQILRPRLRHLEDLNHLRRNPRPRRAMPTW